VTGGHTLVIGAGVGGLSAAALLLQAGRRVTVVEAQAYPGGCASTFYHRGYHFDAGATLAGGFAPGGPHARLADRLQLEWPVRPVDPAWTVHLAGQVITQWADRDRWRAERQAAFPGSEHFWLLQEALASRAWDIASRPFPWPPQSARDWATLARAARFGLWAALPHGLRTMGDLAPAGDRQLRAFLDAQLLISAQTTSAQANALYGSAALDLPRRGVNHVRGGMGALAETLAQWIRAHGGEIVYRQRVTAIDVRAGRAVAVRTLTGAAIAGDSLVANVTPEALSGLLGGMPAAGPRADGPSAPEHWGAFTLYLGLDAAKLPAGLADHQQVVVDTARALGEGNSVFLSLSDAADPTRAPDGQRAATLSTHTAVAPWWAARQQGRAAYDERKLDYAERLLSAAEQALPGLRRAIRFQMAGTPVTFEHFTGRPRGVVGGFPQTSLFRVRGPRTSLPNVWLVGDSIFPGQSTAGVTLGAWRVAAEVLAATRPAHGRAAANSVPTLYKT
jgi:C-3',4' desaturase CrtD